MVRINFIAMVKSNWAAFIISLFLCSNTFLRNSSEKLLRKIKILERIPYRRPFLTSPHATVSQKGVEERHSPHAGSMTLS